MRSKLITSIGCALALGMVATAAHAQQMDDPNMPPPPAGDYPRSGPHGGPHGGRGFEAMDVNHDGFVTMDEWKAAGRREDRFAMIDTDHDGKITRDEMRAFMQKMRAEHPDGRGRSGGGNVGDGAMQPPTQ